MPENRETTCCIVGGGPAGIMLGMLLARAGVDVTVLEKYPDFFRDFRGDTIHPSTLQLMYELGWIDDFLKVPHNEIRTVSGNIAGDVVHIADFTHLPTHCKFMAFTPQWDFLDFIAGKAKNYPTFHLMMETEGLGLIEDGGRVTGIRARGKDGEFTISAALVVGTDGRHSTIRAAAGFEVENIGAPMDVLWMRIPKEPQDPPQSLGNMREGRFLVLIDREAYWQCAFIIPKGSYDEWKARGIEALQNAIVETVPALRERAQHIADWKDVSMLEVRVDRLHLWHRPGVLCIGDAAHAMSPIGGVGINLAIQDAVASANRLAEPLRSGFVGDEVLAHIQTRRMFPTKVTQAIQVFIQNHGVAPVLAGTVVDRAPLPFQILNDVPYLQRLPAVALGLGVRPEHIRTPDSFAKS